MKDVRRNAGNKDYAGTKFFFAQLRNISSTFSDVFGNGGRRKPHSEGYRRFAENWGIEKTLYEMANEEITKVAEIKQLYLTDTLMFLTYLIQKQEADEQEDKYQEMLSKAKKGGR